MDLLNLTVPGDPVPKGRPRAGGGQIYTPARTAAAEELIRGLAQRAYGRRPAYTGIVGVDVEFFCRTRRRTDGDNLLKLITDAIQRGRRKYGGVIVDDSQIEDWRCRVHRGLDGEPPRTVIRVYPLDITGLTPPPESRAPTR